MAKSIAFAYRANRVDFEMIKIDRSKLYGYKEADVVDEQGHPCELATLAEDGRTVIGRGGTGIGYLTVDGNWTDKTQLTPVNLDGEKITPIPSSFAAPIELRQTVSIEEYLNHNIRLVYKLNPRAGAEALFKELAAGAIYKFDYSFRGGLEWDAGFLMLNEDQDICFLVGDPTTIEYISLKQVSVIADTADEDEADMDFGMI